MTLLSSGLRRDNAVLQNEVCLKFVSRWVLLFDWCIKPKTFLNWSSNQFCSPKRTLSIFNGYVLDTYMTGKVVWNRKSVSPVARGDDWIQVMNYECFFCMTNRLKCINYLNVLVIVGIFCFCDLFLQFLNIVIKLTH